MKVHILPLVVSLKSSFTTDLLGFFVAVLHDVDLIEKSSWADCPG